MAIQQEHGRAQKPADMQMWVCADRYKPPNHNQKNYVKWYPSATQSSPSLSSDAESQPPPTVHAVNPTSHPAINRLL
eukprot:c36123_g1_i1 orf=101-331(+)